MSDPIVPPAPETGPLPTPAELAERTLGKKVQAAEADAALPDGHSYKTRKDGSKVQVDADGQEWDGARWVMRADDGDA